MTMVRLHLHDNDPDYYPDASIYLNMQHVASVAYAPDGDSARIIFSLNFSCTVSANSAAYLLALMEANEALLEPATPPSPQPAPAQPMPASNTTLLNRIIQHLRYNVDLSGATFSMINEYLVKAFPDPKTDCVAIIKALNILQQASTIRFDPQSMRYSYLNQLHPDKYPAKSHPDTTTAETQIYPSLIDRVAQYLRYETVSGATFSMIEQYLANTFPTLHRTHTMILTALDQLCAENVITFDPDRGHYIHLSHQLSSPAF